jgi:GntR family transcriptional regulator
MGQPSWVSVSMPYVVPHADSAGDAWSAEAAAHGRSGTQRLLEVTETTPPPEVAEAFGVAPSTLAVVRRRMILLDECPVELADSYYPAAIARGTALAECRKIRGGAVTLLAELGHRPKLVREDVHARPATAAERDLLRLTDQQWVLCLRRVLITADGLPVEVSTMSMVAEGRHLRYELTID